MNRVFLVKSHPQFTRGASVVRKRGRRSITSKHPTLAGPGMAYPHQGTNSAALGSEPGQPASPVTARHCTRNSAVSLAPCFLTSAEHFKFSSNEKEFFFFLGRPKCTLFVLNFLLDCQLTQGISCSANILHLWHRDSICEVSFWVTYAYLVTMNKTGRNLSHNSTSL